MAFPRSPTPLRGRDVQLAELQDASQGPGLTTLWGPGGVGKTRLAAELTQLRRRAQVSVTWVSVPDDVEPEELAGMCASAAGVPDGFGAGLSTPERLDRWIERAPVGLLVVDEAERAMAASQHLADALSHAASLHLLMTSRVPLERSHERVVEVDPLDAAAAAELFRDAAPRGTYLVHDDIAAAVRQLAGLPMAIELAAARLEVLPMAALLERLADPLPALRDPGRHDRHAALSASLTASWEVLPPWARSALGQLATFAHEVSLAAAEGVLQLDEDASALDALHLLTRRCLVRRVGDDDAARYRLAPFVPEFARAHRPEPQAARRHAAWFGSASIEVLYAWHRGETTSRWLETESAELALATRRCLAGEVTSRAALGRCGAAWAFAMGGRRSTESRLQLVHDVQSALHQRDGPADPRAEGKLYEAVASLRSRQGDLDAVEASLQDGLTLARRGEVPELQVALTGLLGNLRDHQGRQADARRAFAESLALAERCGHGRGETAGLLALALVDLEMDWDPEVAQQRLARVVELAAPTDPQIAGYAQCWLAGLCIAQGRPDEALIHTRAGLDAAESTYVVWLEAHARRCQGQALLASDRPEEAVEALHEAVAVARESSSRDVAVEAAAFQALALLQLGQTYQATAVLQQSEADLAEYDAKGRALVAAVHALTEAVRHPEQPPDRSALARAVQVVEDPAFPSLVPTVEALTFRIRLRRALEDGSPHTAEAPAMVSAAAARHLLVRACALPWLRQLDRSCQDLQRAWVLAPTGFTPPGGSPVELTRFRAPCRIFGRLVELRIDHPGHTATSEDLVGVGWPDAMLAEATARNRLHVALNTLRKAGLTLLERSEGAYRLDPRIPARRG